MIVSLRGSSPRCLVAGVLLMSRARQFGQRIEVHVVGDPVDISPVVGPAVVMSPVLASCGVGRRHGGSGLVLVAGQADEPLAACFELDGCGPWMYLDRSGRGLAPETRALLALRADAQADRRALANAVLRMLRELGLPIEASLLDLMFAAPAAPLERVALALRAGAALAGRSREPQLGGWLDASALVPDPLPIPVRVPDLLASVEDGRLDAILGRLHPSRRPAARAWAANALAARHDTGEADTGEYNAVSTLAAGLVELLGAVAALPPGVPLPALDAAADAVARGLPAALGAIGEATPAHDGLLQTFRLFGGRFVSEARGAVELEGPPPPADPLARWAWFCAQAKAAATEADRLWRRVIDPES